MALTIDQIKELKASPKKKQTLSKAILQESRIRFHVESAMESSEVAQPATVFLEWVKGILPKDKYAIFLSLFRYPTPITSLTNTLFEELERVFDGRNPALIYQFEDSELKVDWDGYRKERLQEPRIWRKKGWEAVKTAINSVLIVDLPVEQTGEYPEPYFYLLGVENIIDYGMKGDDIDYILFKQDGNKIAAFDDEYYRVIQLNDKGEMVGEPIETPHELGYCPAKFFWSTSLTKAYPEVKKSPLSAQLAKLDWLLFFETSKKHLDLYAPYPIYSTYASDCDFENSETGDYCDGGYLRDSNQNYKILSSGTVQQCPVCAQKNLAGVGSFVEVPIPVAGEPDLRDPVTITTIDKSSLEYNVEEVNRLKAEVFAGVVGNGGDVQTKQSINEMQVTANFEGRLNVLNSLKSNLEEIQQFTDDTICKLRYGDFYLGSSISYGTEFYMYSVADLYAQYKVAKTNGSSEAELEAISEQILVTEYRNNPSQLRRMLTLKHLEPYRHHSFDEVMSLSEKSLLDDELLRIKINFHTFVGRFERENMDIVEFGSQLDFDKKIKIIIDKFKEYGREQQRRPDGAI